MDMRRLAAGKLVRESPMEARLREFRKSGGSAAATEATVPNAARSMVDIPQSPIYDEHGPQPKGSLPKQSASYSYNAGAALAGSAGSSFADPEAAGLPGKASSPGPNRTASAYKSMALASYNSQKQAAKLERNLSNRAAQDDSDSDASSQTDSEGEGRRSAKSGATSAKSAASRHSSVDMLQSGTISAKSASTARSGASSPKRGGKALARRAMPGSPEQDSDSDVGPTTSESESDDELGMTANERMDMMMSSSGTALQIQDRSARARSSARGSAAGSAGRGRAAVKKTKTLVNASLYVAAKQPPWVEAAIAEKEAMQAGSDEVDSSEDERDRLREGKTDGKYLPAGATRGGLCWPCRAACGSCKAGCRRLTSKPETHQQELPPDREWERAEKALSASGANITKRWRNCWGRCSFKRLTLPVQLRLIQFGWNPTASSSKRKQLMPQIIGFFLVFMNAGGLGTTVDLTGTRLFGERNYMLFVHMCLGFYCVQFCNEHHRECWSGQLLVHFEGRTWQVLNTQVKDRLAEIGTHYMKWWRYCVFICWAYYGSYLWWAASFLAADGSEGGKMQYAGARLMAGTYPIMVYVTTAFIMLTESAMLCDRIDAYANGLSSAQYVFSRPEAQAEHDLVLASAQSMSKRWGPMLVFSAFCSILSTALLGSFFMETSWSPEGKAARWAPCDPVFCILLSVVLWCSAARIAIHADRLTALSVGVSGSRIPLKGMLGRTSWCNYFMSLPISVEIEGRMRVTPENVCTMLAAGGVFLLYMGLNPDVCDDGWFSCEGNEMLGRDSDN